MNEEKNSTETKSSTPSGEKDSGAGPLIGSILIIIIIILGGWYYLNSLTTQIQEETPVQEESSDTDMEAELSTSTLSESSDVSALEADINTTEIGDIDAELEQLEAELDADLDQI